MTFSSLTWNTKKTIPCVPQTLNIKLHHFQNNPRICWGSIVQCRLLQTVRSCTFDNLRKSPFTHDRKQSLFLRRFRGICVPRTLWWPLSYLTLIGGNDIVKPRAVTWHCFIFQIKSLIGWFEIRFEKAYICGRSTFWSSSKILCWKCRNLLFTLVFRPIKTWVASCIVRRISCSSVFLP